MQRATATAGRWMGALGTGLALPFFSMIAQAAYFRAEKRGFAAGCELDDWLEAEREIARMLDE